MGGPAWGLEPASSSWLLPALGLALALALGLTLASILKPSP